MDEGIHGKMKEEGEITLLKAHNKDKEEKQDINITIRLDKGLTALKILESLKKEAMIS